MCSLIVACVIHFTLFHEQFRGSVANLGEFHFREVPRGSVATEPREGRAPPIARHFWKIGH